MTLTQSSAPPRRLAGRLLATAAGLVLTLGLAVPAMAITTEEIITLTKLGISPDEVIKAIDKDRTVFDLGVTDILALKKAGVDEKVLKYMLATPQTFGDGAAGGGGAADGGGTAGAGATEPAPPEETPEERAAREERLRQEALRLKEEQRAAEEMQRKAFADGVLKRGQDQANSGDFVGSIQTFQKFMEQGGFGPETEEAYIAKFGIANALTKAGLYQAAANQLVEVLLAGPERPFFQAAFDQLRELRRKVNYSPPDLEELTKFFVGSFSQGFQDSYNYVLGEFYYDYNNWTKALGYLEQVSPSSIDYARAQYLKGLVEVRNQMARSAVQSFQKAIIATDENGSDGEVKDLAFLALARIAYEVGDYDAAIYYYRKVPKGSYKEATAYYESAWVYFLKGDYSRAVGTFHTLQSPYFRHSFYSELWILEATTYLNICQFDLTEAALTRFREDVQPLALPLKDFLLKTVRPSDYYKAVVSVLKGKELYDLPRPLVSPILGNIEFYNLYRTIKQIEREQDTIQASVNKLGGYGEELLRRLGQLRQERIREVGIKIQRILKDVESDLQEYGDKATEIAIDLEDIRLEEEERKLRALGAGDEEVAEEETVDAGGSTAIVGSDQWRWVMENEYWLDEIGTFRAFVSNKCAKEEDGF